MPILQGNFLWPDSASDYPPESVCSAAASTALTGLTSPFCAVVAVVLLLQTGLAPTRCSR